MATAVTSVLVLAGGGSPADLAVATGCAERALIAVGGAPMIAHVLRALGGLTEFETIAVVGSDAVLATARAEREIVAVPAGGRMVDNLRAGMEALGGDGPALGSVLVCTCDIPLVTAATFEELISAANAADLELAYPIVRREVSEAAFPSGNRTYARLQRGEYTGGNAVIVPARIMHEVLSHGRRGL